MNPIKTTQIFDDKIVTFNQDMKMHSFNDSPAVLYTSGVMKGRQDWYTNGIRNRASGLPAIIWIDKSKLWIVNGKRHREDGPAYIGSDGKIKYYLNDKRVMTDQDRSKASKRSFRDHKSSSNANLTLKEQSVTQGKGKSYRYEDFTPEPFDSEYPMSIPTQYPYPYHQVGNISLNVSLPETGAVHDNRRKSSRCCELRHSDISSIPIQLPYPYHEAGNISVNGHLGHTANRNETKSTSRNQLKQAEVASKNQVSIPVQCIKNTIRQSNDRNFTVPKVSKRQRVTVKDSSEQFVDLPKPVMVDGHIPTDTNMLLRAPKRNKVKSNNSLESITNHILSSKDNVSEFFGKEPTCNFVIAQNWLPSMSKNNNNFFDEIKGETSKDKVQLSEIPKLIPSDIKKNNIIKQIKTLDREDQICLIKQFVDLLTSANN